MPVTSTFTCFGDKLSPRRTRFSLMFTVVPLLWLSGYARTAPGRRARSQARDAAPGCSPRAAPWVRGSGHGAGRVQWDRSLAWGCCRGPSTILGPVPREQERLIFLAGHLSIAVGSLRFLGAPRKPLCPLAGNQPAAQGQRGRGAPTRTLPGFAAKARKLLSSLFTMKCRFPIKRQILLFK